MSHTCAASNLDPEMVPQWQGHFRARGWSHPPAAGTGAAHSGQTESKERVPSGPQSPPHTTAVGTEAPRGQEVALGLRSVSVGPGPTLPLARRGALRKAHGPSSLGFPIGGSRAKKTTSQDDTRRPLAPQRVVRRPATSAPPGAYEKCRMSAVPQTPGPESEL